MGGEHNHPSQRQFTTCVRLQHAVAAGSLAEKRVLLQIGLQHMGNLLHLGAGFR